MFLLFPKMTLSANEYLLVCCFERFQYEEIIYIDREVLQFILLRTKPLQFRYSGTSKNIAWRSIFYSRVLGFRNLSLICSTKVPGCPSTTSRMTPPLLYPVMLSATFNNLILTPQKYQLLVNSMRKGPRIFVFIKKGAAALGGTF